VVKKVALFKDVHFFTNPKDKTEVFSVINEEMRTVAKARGYIELNPSHYTDVTSLPQIVATTEDEGTNSAWADQPAPSVYAVPEGRNYPILWKKYDDETTAAAIVRAVEERVVVKMTEKVWSPYRLWTPQDRKGKGSSLTKYLTAYYFIRVTKKGERPEDIKLNVSDMVKAALAAKAVVAANTNDPSPNNWHEITVRVYAEVSRE
jgi:hypothetical protein